jgi:hypothetical protein
MEMQETVPDCVPDAGQLLALVDSLWSGTLNKAQKEAMQELRTGILVLAVQVEHVRL